MNEPQRESWRERDLDFVRYLYGLANPENPRGRGALAAFRRGLGREPGDAPEMFPYLVPRTEGLSGWNEKVYYLVASLFALNPSKEGERAPANLGGSMRSVATAENGDPNDLAASVQRRFMTLLESDRHELPDRLRHAVQLCASKPVPINWLELLHDVRRWRPIEPDARQQPIQLKWARAFWRRESAQDDVTRPGSKEGD